MELLRKAVLQRDGARRQRCQTDYRGPAVGEGNQAARRLRIAGRHDRVRFLGVHRQRALAELEGIAVEEVARRRPGGPLSARQEETPSGRDEQPSDQLLGCLGRQELVVVDDEPRIVRPIGEVFRQELLDDVDLLLWLAACREPLPQATPHIGYQRLDGVCDAKRERGDIAGRRGALIPRVRSAGQPLPSERRLAVAGRGDEHDRSRGRLVEEPRQPGALDDVAPPRPNLLPCLVLHPCLGPPKP